MPQLLRLILLVAVIAAIGIGVYYWMEGEEGVKEDQVPVAPAEELEQP